MKICSNEENLVHFDFLFPSRSLNFNKTFVCCSLDDLLVSTSTTFYTLPPSAR